MSLGFRVGAVAAMVGVVGCLHVTDVPGPDGETAHLISCGASEECFEKAGELCPAGYVLRSSTSKTHGGAGGMSSSDEIVVSCKADLPESAQGSTSTSTSTSTSAPEDQGRAVCEAAYRIQGEFAAYWAGRTPGAKRLEELPNVHDFVEVCLGMPDRVRRCMHEHWRQSHAQSCEAVLSRLAPRQEDEIDGLFLVATPHGGTGAATE